MTTQPGGHVARAALKVGALTLAAVLGMIALYAMAGVLERALDKLPGLLQLIILAAAIAVVWAQRRHFAPNRVERDLERGRADAGSGAGRFERFRVWREARDSRFVQRIRQEAAAAGAGTEAAVAAALATLDATLARHRADRAVNETMIERALTDAHATAAETAANLANAAEQVANMCIGIIGHIQDSREQTRELERAIAQLPSRRPVAHDHVVSLVEEEARERAEQADEFVLEPADNEPADSEPPSEVLCFDNDEWIGGVEIVDRTGENGTARYWLRRASDGYIFPRSFGADEIWRPAPEAESVLK